MFVCFNRRKKSYSTKGLCALFRIRERSKRKAHVKIKPKERLNVMAAIKGKSKLKSLLSKIFRNIMKNVRRSLVNKGQNKQQISRNRQGIQQYFLRLKV